MTLNARLLETLRPVIPTVAPGIYTGEEVRYLTFNYDLVPVSFADNGTGWWRALIQIHLVLPLGENSVELRGEVARALVGAGFPLPEVTDAAAGERDDGERSCQHYVFETETIISLKGE